jgi:hypothetical protein
VDCDYLFGNASETPTPRFLPSSFYPTSILVICPNSVTDHEDDDDEDDWDPTLIPSVAFATSCSKPLLSLREGSESPLRRQSRSQLFDLSDGFPDLRASQVLAQLGRESDQFIVHPHHPASEHLRGGE